MALGKKHYSTIITPLRKLQVRTTTHHTLPPLPPPGRAQEDVLSEGPQPRDGEKEGKGSRTSGEVEESKMAVKRRWREEIRRGEISQRGGNRRKEKGPE